VQERADVPFAELTTLRVGGPARRLLVATTDDEVVEAVKDADRVGRPLLVIGDGSNLLVGGTGFDGDVLQVATSGITVVDRDDRHVEIGVAAGTPWDDVVAHCVDSGWGGVETLSGIPGRCGATPIQNVGAYGHEVAQVLRRVTVLDRSSGAIRDLSDDACRFGYRTSRFKAEPDHYVVLAVRLRLTTDGLSAPIRYAELSQALATGTDARAPVDQVRSAVLALRRSKAMVLDPADHDTWSAGSFFTNPVLTDDVAAGLPDGAPRFAQSDGRVKTSAAWLIEYCGLGRGYPGETAPARLSTRHVLALTNRGTATPDDLLRLARRVRDVVHDRLGIELVPEPVLVSCSL
jgi:UDP-N-acetylmuramate dehydrogenase